MLLFPSLGVCSLKLKLTWTLRHHSNPKAARMAAHTVKHKDRFTNHQPSRPERTKHTCENNRTAASLTQLGAF